MTATAPAPMRLSDFAKTHSVPKGGKVVHRSGKLTVVDATGATVAMPEYTAEQSTFIAKRWAAHKAVSQQARAAAPAKPKPTKPVVWKGATKPDFSKLPKPTPPAPRAAGASVTAAHTPTFTGSNGNIAYAIQNIGATYVFAAQMYALEATSITGSAQLFQWLGVEDEDLTFVFQPVMEYNTSEENWTLFSCVANESFIAISPGTVSVSVETSQSGYFIAQDADNTYYAAFDGYEDETGLLYDVGDVYMAWCAMSEEAYNFSHLPSVSPLSFIYVTAMDFDSNTPTDWSYFKNNSYVESVTVSGNNYGTCYIQNIDD